MPPHPREVFFEATGKAYAVGVTLFGQQRAIQREVRVAPATERDVNVGMLYEEILDCVDCDYGCCYRLSTS